MIKNFIFIFAIAATVVACTQNAITGRSQLTLLPESQLQSMATTQYQEFLSSNKVVTIALVRRLGYCFHFPGSMSTRPTTMDLFGPQWRDIIHRKQFLCGSACNRLPMGTDRLSF